VPLLVKAGHTVTGTRRNADKAEAIRTAGAAPAVVDALDARAVRDAVTRAKPDVVIHELTAIPRRELGCATPVFTGREMRSAKAALC
jgi:2-alkyl-3-oxoalkanoate reductase